MNRKNTAATDRLIEAVHGSYVCMGHLQDSRKVRNEVSRT